MISESETVERLHRTAHEFSAAVSDRNWTRAKALYNKALTVVVFMELDQRHTQELFGQWAELRDDETAPEGLFRRHDVSRVDLECCIKRHKAYEDMACMKWGKEVEYYSDEDYCARCKKAKK